MISPDNAWFVICFFKFRKTQSNFSCQHLVNINLAGVAPLVKVQFHIQTPKMNKNPSKKNKEEEKNTQKFQKKIKDEEEEGNTQKQKKKRKHKKRNAPCKYQPRRSRPTGRSTISYSNYNFIFKPPRMKKNPPPKKKKLKKRTW